MDLTVMERVGDRWEKMEGYFSTGRSPQQAVVSVEEEDEEEGGGGGGGGGGGTRKVRISLFRVTEYNVLCSTSSTVAKPNPEK
jgi:hypothetical protein